jgi:hypothetical protein
MNEKLERMWKAVVMTYFKIVSWNFPGGTEENHRNKSGWK